MKKSEKPSLEEVKRNKEQEKLQKETQEVAEQIDKILTEHSFGIQSYIHPVVAGGVIASLEAKSRLVKIDKNEEAKS